MRLITALVILLFTSNTLMAQFNYDAHWKKVEEAEQKGLPKTALEEVNVIYHEAIKAHHQPQILKSLIYRIKEDGCQTDSVGQYLADLNNELAHLSAPAQGIVHSIQAQIIWHYQQENRYSLYSRTAVANDTSTDINTWDATRLSKEVTAAYKASLANKTALQAVNIADYDVVLTKGTPNARPLRPTLYDLLVHRALDYFKSGENSANRPADQFEVLDPEVFATPAAFAAHHFKTTDTSSLQYQALLLMQELSTFHANSSKAVQLDIEIERIQYANQIGVMPDKESLYVAALKRMQTTYADEKGVAAVLGLLAQYYAGQGALTTDKVALNTMMPSEAMRLAKSLAEKGIQIAAGEPAADLCYQVLNNLILKDLSLQSEQVNLPTKPFRTLVSYKNLDKIYLRVVSVNENFKQSLRDAQQDYRDTTNKYWRMIRDRQPVKTWEQALPGSDDYRSHTTEIKVDGLPIGSYMILASAKPSFQLDDNILSMQFVHVSNISYLNDGNDTAVTSFYVLHRETGKPLSNVKLTVWAQTYRSNDKEKLKKLKTGVSDADGLVKVTLGKITGQNLRYEWDTKEDSLFLDDYTYVYNYNYGTTDKLDTVHSYLFTDRSIYRPGQTVFFKGIVFNQRANNKHDVKANYKTKVTLTDANGDVVDTVELTTNEYGSYVGKFNLPVGRLNGSFTLANESIGYTYFSVEEYKRPKFYVEFDPVGDSYRLGDSVKVTGKAIAYAGNNIDGAKVTFRVTRSARFPYAWLMWGRSPMYSAQREILQGEAQTDAEGKFTVTFPAVPDLAVSPDTKPIFSYAVTANITDLNGETRSGTASVNAGYQALQIVVGVDEQLQQKDLNSVHIYTNNLNGKPQPAKVDVTISPLKAPDHLLRKRYWDKPDQFVMTADEFRKNFPLDVYKNEDDVTSWEKGAAVVTKQIQTGDSSRLALDKTLAAGWYVIELSTTDRYGVAVVEKKNFEVVDPNAKTLSYTTYAWSYDARAVAQPGDKTPVLIGTSAKDVYVLQVAQKMDTHYTNSAFNLDAHVVNREYTATEADRGGVFFRYFFVKDNRVYYLSKDIYVPWSNKDLNVTIASHRDKLLPGASEKWTVTIKGNKGDAVAAEMMTTMFDASLDAFRYQSWNIPPMYPSVYADIRWTGEKSFKAIASESRNEINTYISNKDRKDFTYDALAFDCYGSTRIVLRGMASVAGSPRVYRKEMAVAKPGADAEMEDRAMPAPAPMASAVAAEPLEMLKKDKSVASWGNAAADSASASTPDTKPAEKVQPRTNFNETAFFIPQLHTDKDGNISFDFTVPEALTRWRMIALAHTKDAAFGLSESSVITQKPLMVQPNAPRFMREGDKMEFTAKISNLADSALTGEAHLELLDAATMKPVDGWFQNVYPVQHFTVEKGQSTAVIFSLQVPYKFNSALLYRVVAQSGIYSDGEENALPVLTNSMLVTETMPLTMRGDGTRNFKLDKLLHSDTSETLQQHAFTLEYTSNPAWYAVQALPYLMEYPYECSEQIFSRYYANTLASYISNAIPGVKTTFDKWRTTDTAALQSNLQKNEELKAVLLQETPWVAEAKNESEQKKRIALLFDLNRMSQEQNKALGQLKERQLPNGAFPWFTGMWEDQFITQHIVAGIGRLRQVGAVTDAQYRGLNNLLDKAIAYLDQKMDAEYYELKRMKVDMKKDHLGYMAAHFLYMHSLYKDRPVAAKYKESYEYMISQAKQYWLNQSIYKQGLLALALHGKGDDVTAKAIVRSLKENATVSEELGMYWKSIRSSYWWYEAPVETQSLMVAVFDQVTHDTAAVSDLKTWLLKNKQTNNWSTTKSTSDAVYAMLLGGNSNWLAATPTVEIKAGEHTINSTDVKTEAGTGYFKQTYTAETVKPDMGNISVTVKGSNGQPSWGAAYWQYFEQLDKISSAATPLILQKQLFIERNTNAGPVLTAIEDGNELKVGDKVKARVVLKVDRDMEYVHLRDMRAACFEPIDVISTAGWQNGVSYYQSTKDASTNFFFSRLPKGTYVFEYAMFVTHEGNFSNGISTAQCMYAPEFSAHSEGIRVKVKE
jgi:uncharacterized protein YfaS (alpha-2-macroglobulin family)